MKKNNPARRAGEKNNLAPILSEKNILAQTKNPSPPPLNIKWTVPNKYQVFQYQVFRFLHPLYNYSSRLKNKTSQQRHFGCTTSISLAHHLDQLKRKIFTFIFLEFSRPPDKYCGFCAVFGSNTLHVIC